MFATNRSRSSSSNTRANETSQKDFKFSLKILILNFLLFLSTKIRLIYNINIK
jgi:hypothetical protein